MSRGVKTGFAVLVALVLVFPAGAFARKAINVQRTVSPVLFDHGRHVQAQCTVCHEVRPTATPPASPVQLTTTMNCQKCHDLLDGEEPPAEGCINCHNDINPPLPQ